MGLAWLRAHAGTPAVVGTAISTMTCAATADQSTNLAGVQVRTTWFLLLLCVTFQSLVLNPAFPELDRTLTRIRTDRALQALAFTGLSAPPLWVLTTLAEPRTLTTWYLLLCSIALVSSTGFPDRGWLAILALGGGSILLDHLLLNSPVSTVMVSLPPAAAPMLTIAALGGFMLTPRGQLRP
jgi:hypothetical protein